MSTRTGPQWQVTATPPAAPQAAPAADGRTPAPAPLQRNSMPNAREAFEAAQQFRALQQQQRAAPAMPEWLPQAPPSAAPGAPPAQTHDPMQAFLAFQQQQAAAQAARDAMLMQVIQRQQAPAGPPQPQQPALPSPRDFGFEVEPEQEQALQRYFTAMQQVQQAPYVQEIQQLRAFQQQQAAQAQAAERQRVVHTQIDAAMAAVRLGAKHRPAIIGLVMQGVAPEQAVRQHIEAWQESLKPPAPAPPSQPGQHYMVQPWAAHARTDDLANGAGGSQFTEVAPFQVDTDNGTKDLTQGLLAMLSGRPVGRG